MYFPLLNATQRDEFFKLPIFQIYHNLHVFLLLDIQRAPSFLYSEIQFSKHPSLYMNLCSNLWSPQGSRFLEVPLLGEKVELLFD